MNIVRRKHVLWSCNKHPDGGKFVFNITDPKIIELKKTQGISTMNNLIKSFPGVQFNCSRMDEYLMSRGVCCRVQLYANRTKLGYNIFQNLLGERGKHYKTCYTLLTPEKDYKGKHKPCLIKCEVHKKTFNYSMTALNYTTSCPCADCRVDPNHKNTCVDIILKRNGGREGQVIRHASNVKKKYNNCCMLSNQTVDLHHHHVDGQDFYTETALDWNNNGVCLASTLHRDYHNNFLKNFSSIASEYSSGFFTASAPEEGILESNPDNPDFDNCGAEVSRYTFFEYLKFLIFDIKKNNSVYVNRLNNELKARLSKLKLNGVSEITLQSLNQAITEYCKEYKGSNWALATREDIVNANNKKLWQKVDNLWKVN